MRPLRRAVAALAAIAACLGACEPRLPRGGPVETAPPAPAPPWAAPVPVPAPVVETVIVEEPARPAEDAPEVRPVYDDETEGLDLDSWEGSGFLGGNGTIGGSGTLARPFPNRRAAFVELSRGRGRATQEAVVAELSFLRDRAIRGGGWAERGAVPDVATAPAPDVATTTAPDVATTALGVLACFSTGDAWTGHRETGAARDACKWLTRNWLARGNGTAARDAASHTPPELRAQALLTLALSEWRAWTWVVYAMDEGALAVEVLRARARDAFPDGRPVASEDAATDAAWTLLALHVARLAEFEFGTDDAQRVLAVLDRPVDGPSDDRAAAARSVARALGVAFHRSGAMRSDVLAALGPALRFSLDHSEAFERPSDLMFLASIAAMQVGGETARDWNRRVLRPLAARPRATDVREAALAAMSLSSYYRYTPAVGDGAR